MSGILENFHFSLSISLALSLYIYVYIFDTLHFLGVTVPTKAAFKLEAHEGEVMCVQWDYPGRYFATAGTDRKIKVWEISKYHQAGSI